MGQKWGKKKLNEPAIVVTEQLYFYQMFAPAFCHPSYLAQSFPSAVLLQAKYLSNTNSASSLGTGPTKGFC